MIQPTFAPIATLQECSLEEANTLLVLWAHKMGALDRGCSSYGAQGQYLLMHESAPIAVATHSTLIRAHVGGGLGHMTRADTIELSRLCATRPHINRVMLRLWRELVFPSLGFRFAISYQDSLLHAGDTYRFDGWHRSPERSRSGTDSRTGKTGRSKWVWWWENPHQSMRTSAIAPERVTQEAV